MDVFRRTDLMTGSWMFVDTFADVPALRDRIIYILRSAYNFLHTSWYYNRYETDSRVYSERQLYAVYLETEKKKNDKYKRINVSYLFFRWWYPIKIIKRSKTNRYGSAI